MTTADAARRTLDWIAERPQPNHWIDRFNVPGHMLGQEYSHGPDAVFPSHSEIPVLAAVALANGWTVHHTYGFYAVTASLGDAAAVPIKEAASAILDIPDTAVERMAEPGTDHIAALKCYADGGRPEDIYRLYKRDVAQKILDLFDLNPDLHDQAAWFSIDMDSGATELPPAGEVEEYDCGTTMCVAGAACHVTGYTLRPAALVTKDGVDCGHLEDTARRVMGLARHQADWLFASSRTPDEVYDTLTLIADGGHPTFTDADDEWG
jgi:hypothetical protein